MSADRELLYLSAKAAGLRVKHEIENMDDECIGLCVKVDGLPKFDWNPLTDDGAALRLAVKLQMNVGQGYEMAFADLTIVSDDEDVPALHAEANEDYSSHGGDMFAATRRAIVRAAAEIGRSLP